MTRKDNWIQTYTGQKFWPTDPRPDDIFLEDIAHALALKCRFAGHCNQFYSVAQHSVYCARFIRGNQHRMWALLHEAAEAYLPDVCSPIKQELTGFKEMEQRILDCVAERFSLPVYPKKEIAEIDLIMLHTERIHFFNEVIPWPSTEGVEPIDFGKDKRINGWNWQQAEVCFLSTYEDLMSDDRTS